MSEDNVELVRAMQETYLGPEPERALAFFDADVELDATDRPDGKVWYGRDGVRRAMIEWTGAWDDWQVAIEGYSAVGEDQVLVLWRERGRGKGSGVPMEQDGANLATIRNGRIVRMRLYLRREDAFADATAANEPHLADESRAHQER
jgi:ketosteroid isomerase-like protein